MEEAFQHKHIFQYIDLVLIDKDQSSLHPTLQEKSVRWNQNPKEVVSKLKKAEILYIHPDGFDKWTDILFYLAEKTYLPTKLVIIAGSDYAIGDEHMEPFLAFFPRTEFWICNWCGSFERCRALPLGTNGQVESILQKTRPLGISFLLNYIGNPKREEFFDFINKHPEIQVHCLERAGFQEYCTTLSTCLFSTCPMGEGFDTYRFWESLMVGTIPIVKDHPFYETLLEYYPNLPIIRLKAWDDLLTLLPELTDEKWLTIMTRSTMDVSKKSYWIERLNRLLNTGEQN